MSRCISYGCVNVQVELVDYKTSMITDEDPQRGLLSYQDLGFAHTRHFLQKIVDGQIDGQTLHVAGAQGPGGAPRQDAAQQVHCDAPHT